MVESDAVAPDVDARVVEIADGFDPRRVVAALRADRDGILARWLEVTARQPFHEARPELAVADHVPSLFDATVALLGRSGAAAPTTIGAPPEGPADDAAIATAASAHAQVRFEQGLGPIAIVTEFRLLRLEVARALGALLADEVPATDVVASLALIGDVLDAAATVAVSALAVHMEDLRESFLVTTMHDIRQPITLVSGSLHLAHRWLVADEPDTSRVREAIEDALSATTELVAMIDTMSDASRVALGELDPDREPASLEEIVRESVAAFGKGASARVTLDAPVGHRLIGLWDVRLLHRVVANLVGNALKYSGPDGAVTVRVGRGDPGMGRFQVTDDGLGMSEQEMTAVFERFSRGERVRSRGIPGLGLGLFACRGIIMAHGGRIELQSDGPDHGTTVTVELPLVEDDETD